MQEERTMLGVDVGGTNARMGLVRPDGGVVFHRTVETRAHESAGELFEQLARAWHEEYRRREDLPEPGGVGVGAPNVNAATGRIEKAPNLSWRGVDVKDLAGRSFGMPAFADNDANAWARGELRFGAARGMRHMVLVTLGTGLGSGVVVAGRVVSGHTGYAAELGHVTVRPGGRLCGCGRRGCLETYVSATGLVRTAFELLATERDRSSALAGACFDTLTARDVTRAARNGDALAGKAFERTGRMLGRAVANLACLLSPEAVVLAGGLANAGDLLLEPARRAMEEAHFHPFKESVRLLKTGLDPDTAGILGAACLGWDGGAG